MSNSCSVGIFMRSWPTATSLSSSYGWTGNASEPTDLTYFRAGPWEDVSSRMGGAPGVRLRRLRRPTNPDSWQAPCWRHTGGYRRPASPISVQ